MAPTDFQIQIEKCHFETKTLVIVRLKLSPEINVGTAVIIHLFSPNAAGHREARLWPIRWNRRCTPGMGANLWGESPLYENQGRPLI
jgi:hypothetical protein